MNGQELCDHAVIGSVGIYFALHINIKILVLLFVFKLIINIKLINIKNSTYYWSLFYVLSTIDNITHFI